MPAGMIYPLKKVSPFIVNVVYFINIILFAILYFVIGSYKSELVLVKPFVYSWFPSAGATFGFCVFYIMRRVFINDSIINHASRYNTFLIVCLFVLHALFLLNMIQEWYCNGYLCMNFLGGPFAYLLIGNYLGLFLYLGIFIVGCLTFLKAMISITIIIGDFSVLQLDVEHWWLDVIPFVMWMPFLFLIFDLFFGDSYGHFN